MHEILVISGKGGTGKTSLTAAFAHLCSNAIICDLDVDAPDLHLILQPEPVEPQPFVSGARAEIRADDCVQCGTCGEMCRFGAILPGEEAPSVDPVRCEGCGVCVHFCPQQAIDFVPANCGQWSVSRCRFGPVVHAQLFPGEENSGRLVALLRHAARELAESRRADTLLADGPPGIACPAISALSGTDLAVIVTEPTPSGVHDLRRAVDLCRHFRAAVAVVVNKADLNAGLCAEIREYCRDSGIFVAGELPHDPVFVQAMVRGVAVTELDDEPVAGKIRVVWENIQAILGVPKAA